MHRSMEQSVPRKCSRVMIGAMACVAIAQMVAPMAISARAQSALALTLPARYAEVRHTVRFEGVGAEGIDNIWVGTMGGATPGEITLRVEYRGAPMDVAQPVWPVRVMTFVAADDPAQSFLAETEGTLDWKTGAMRLHGSVTQGSMKGAAVEQTITIDRAQLDGGGSLRIDLTTASR